jgi:hypothetical protein
MKFTEVGTTLKHPETIYDNVKNLSKKIISLDKGKIKEMSNFTLRN